MDGCSSRGLGCPQLLDLIPKDREWLVQRGEQRSHGSKSEEKKLELRLGPPGEDYGAKLEREGRKKEDGILSLGYFGGFTNSVDMKTTENGWIMKNNGGQNQQFSFTEKFQSNNNAEKKLFSSSAAAFANPAVVPNSSQKRYHQFFSLALLCFFFLLDRGYSPSVTLIDAAVVLILWVLIFYVCIDLVDFFFNC